MVVPGGGAVSYERGSPVTPIRTSMRTREDGVVCGSRRRLQVPVSQEHAGENAETAQVRVDSGLFTGNCLQ